MFGGSRACNGQTPCARCVLQSVECQYELPVRQSKEQMRSELEASRAQQRQTERVLAALISIEASELVLEQLRNGETVEQIVDRLDSGSQSSAAEGKITSFARPSDHQAIGGALKRARSVISSPLSLIASSESSTYGQSRLEGTAWPPWGSGPFIKADASAPNQVDDTMIWEAEAFPFLDDGMPNSLIGTWHHGSDSDPNSLSILHHARCRGQETILGPSFGKEEHPDIPHLNYNESWTKITGDGAFVEHLMALYFCWEYPTFASLSKEHFLEDMRAGNLRYCSSLLVNALLAVGSRFSTQPQARTDPNDSNTAGDAFFAEAERLLELESDLHTLTTIQALGLMSIREASCGRSSHSIFLSGQSIRLAIEMKLHFDVQDGASDSAKLDHAVRSATFWGAFSLDQVWSMSIGRLPHFSQNAKLVLKPPIVDHVEATIWVAYTDDGTPLETACTQPSNVRSVYKTFCELSEVVHRSLYMLYTPGQPVTAKRLNQIYTEYIQWYSNLPCTLRLGYNFTPSVLFSHMYYHSAILFLFRPFIKLSIIGSGVSPRDLCNQAASTLSILLKSYADLYTLRRTPSFVPYFILASGITHIASLSLRASPDSSTLRQAIVDLREMSHCHGFAIRAVQILRFLIKHWGVDYEMGDDEDRGDPNRSCLCSTVSNNFFCPNMKCSDSMSTIGPVAEGANPLFWPFPLGSDTSMIRPTRLPRAIHYTKSRPRDQAAESDEKKAIAEARLQCLQSLLSVIVNRQHT
ncbi:uncharacterized protein L3040_008251 [Drepanopeziza brunnea f. sp. 'multigermtubi']|uniref:uncharacterized protein n=1 Tax=Drepanopeziza brunnea f. sp. 'multigermtubi' TaxID=698441 RepID=UPI00238442A5|nr:hypothetical protein L3040_008251 [Drepanopeziza brunnea f. sp. 'multigermtubi']